MSNIRIIGVGGTARAIGARAVQGRNTGSFDFALGLDITDSTGAQ